MKKSTVFLIAIVTMVLGVSLARSQSVFTVTNTGDSGPGSLRQAILEANNHTGHTVPDVIQFNIQGSGVQTISPLSQLPDVTDVVIIDGYTQTGSTPNTSAVGNNAVMLIEINGNGTVYDGLTITGGNSTVRGLVVNRFTNSGIVVETNNSDVVQGNFIGTDPTGTVAEGNGADGVYIANGASPGTGNFNLIGGNTPAARNLISGNIRNGMTFDQTTGSMVYGNYIGTNAAGTGALGNHGAGIGIFVGGGQFIIGGAGSYGNLISGNGTNGIQFQSSSNTIQGNLIGTNAAGTAAIPNANDGIRMAAGVYSGVTALTQNNVIGGPAAGNIISGNGVTGIEIVNEGISPTGNSILSNRIGVDITGTTGVPNGTGIVTSGATNTSIGSPAAGAGNQLSGNNGSPISIRGTGTTVQGNLIGTNAAGNSAPSTIAHR